jgi:hypothetical protein
MDDVRKSCRNLLGFVCNWQDIMAYKKQFPVFGRRGEVANRISELALAWAGRSNGSKVKA